MCILDAIVFPPVQATGAGPVAGPFRQGQACRDKRNEPPFDLKNAVLRVTVPPWPAQKLSDPD